MKELQDCIQTRRSVRIYREEPVDRALIRKLIWNGCMAPSGSNIQSWQFIVADDPELVAELVRFSPGIGKYRRASSFSVPTAAVRWKRAE